MRTKKPKYLSVEWLEAKIAEDLAFIAKCGGNLAGYIVHYGDPGIPPADARPGLPFYMHGSGGTLIFDADVTAFRKWVNELQRKDARHGLLRDPRVMELMK